MVSLLIRNEATEEVWRVWPIAEPIQSGSIRETGNYIFELINTELADEANLFIDDLPLEALRTSTRTSAKWRWSPGFHAGVVEAELRIPGQNPKRFEIMTDPDQRKLSRDNFDQMLREILDDTFALFSVGSFRQAIAKGAGAQAPAIARLEFLRSRIEEIEAIAKQISRNPRRLLKANDTSLSYHQAKRATGTEILKSLRSGRILSEKRQQSSLPRQLRGFLPQTIRVRRRVTSLEIPEHRQMSACLKAWALWLMGAADQLETKQVRDDPELSRGSAVWVRRCRSLARRLNTICSAAPFDQPAETRPQLVLSSIFRNDPAYRNFYCLWRDINRGIAAVFGDFLNLPLARTFELYELWCFLRLVRAAVLEFGSSDLDMGQLFSFGPAGSLTIASGSLTVPVGAGWKLSFQRQYREFWTASDRSGSYSRTMTPDVVVSRKADGDGSKDKIIVLDAKYRINQGLNDAIGSIHMYRDALVREASTGKIEGIVSAAYLLTPHLPSLSDNYQFDPLPARLFHPSYRADFKFGAVTLRPGMTSEEIARALRQIVTDATAG